MKKICPLDFYRIVNDYRSLDYVSSLEGRKVKTKSIINQKELTPYILLSLETRGNLESLKPLSIFSFKFRKSIHRMKSGFEEVNAVHCILLCFGVWKHEVILNFLNFLKYSLPTDAYTLLTFAFGRNLQS